MSAPQKYWAGFNTEQEYQQCRSNLCAKSIIDAASWRDFNLKYHPDKYKYTNEQERLAFSDISTCWQTWRKNNLDQKQLDCPNQDDVAFELRRQAFLQARRLAKESELKKQAAKEAFEQKSQAYFDARNLALAEELKKRTQEEAKKAFEQKSQALAEELKKRTRIAFEKLAKRETLVHSLKEYWKSSKELLAMTPTNSPAFLTASASVKLARSELEDAIESLERARQQYTLEFGTKFGGYYTSRFAHYQVPRPKIIPQALFRYKF